MTRLKTLLRYVAGPLILFALQGCSRYVQDVYFIVPPNFTGVIQIQKDEQRGIELPANKPRVEMSVPANGVIALKDLGVLTHGVDDHIVRGGKELELNGNPMSIAGVVRAYSLGYSAPSDGQPEKIGYYVGTPEQWSKLDRAKVGF